MRDKINQFKSKAGKKNKSGRPRKNKVCKTCGCVETKDTPDDQRTFYKSSYSRCIKCQLADQKVKGPKKPEDEIAANIKKAQDRPMEFCRVAELRMMYE